MSLALRCNAKTYSMVTSVTHLITSPNFSIFYKWYPAWILVLQMNFLGGKICAERYFTSEVKWRGSMTLAPRCKSKPYSMFISSTDLISFSNFSIIDKFLTNLRGEIDVQGYLSPDEPVKPIPYLLLPLIWCSTLLGQMVWPSILVWGVYINS